MKLSSFLFEETTEKSNEETIANVVLGIEKSTDPEDLEFDVEKQGLEDFEADTIGGNKLFEAKKERKISNKEQFFLSLLKKQNVYEIQSIQIKKGIFRVKPTEDLKKQLVAKEITKEEFKATLANAKNKMLADLTVTEILPKSKGCASGKYITYIITDTNDKSQFHNLEIKIVFAAGGNKGHDFEAEVEYELTVRRGPNWRNLICFLLQKQLITDIRDFSGYKMATKGQKVRRPLVNKTQNVGEKISDLTLDVYGIPGKNVMNKIYVSLKGEEGATFANLGAGGSFVSTVDQDPTTETEKKICKVTIDANRQRQIFSFLNDAGVDLELVRAGFEAYGNGLLGNNPNYKQETGSANPQIMDWINASLGYGYIYFRRTPSGGYRIFNLDTPDAIKNVTGDFVSDGSVITYPYYMDEHKSSKQCTIKVITTTANYDIELRSTAGGQDGNVTAENFINSLQCNVRVVKVNLAKNKDFVIEPWCDFNIYWSDYAENQGFLIERHPTDESFHKLGKLKLGNLLF